MAEAVVIGGGVMGCSILYNLAERGVTDTVLLERMFWGQALPAGRRPYSGCTTQTR